jgi:hypothetical protein
VSPLFVLLIWSFNWYDLTTSNNLVTYGTYKFNAGAMSFGWGVALISIIAIPCGALHTIVKLPSDLSLIEVLKKIVLSYH